MPVVKIDDAMAEQAVAIGARSGVVGTVRTTLEPTVRLVRAKADAAGKWVVHDLLEQGHQVKNLDRVPLEGFAGAHAHHQPDRFGPGLPCAPQHARAP